MLYITATPSQGNYTKLVYLPFSRLGVLIVYINHWKIVNSSLANLCHFQIQQSYQDQ